MIHDESFDDVLMQRLLELPAFKKNSTEVEVINLITEKKDKLLEELIERMVNISDEN